MRPVSLVSTIDFFDSHEPMVIRVPLFNTWKIPSRFTYDLVFDRFACARRVLFHGSFATLAREISIEQRYLLHTDD